MIIATTRTVPIADASYVARVKQYFASINSLRSDTRIFNFTRQAADARLRKLVSEFECTEGKLSIEVSSHTFRHSFAVNCTLHGVPLTILQHWLGHKDIRSTVIYAQVLTAEAAYVMAHVEF